MDNLNIWSIFWFMVYHHSDILYTTGHMGIWGGCSSWTRNLRMNSEHQLMRNCSVRRWANSGCYTGFVLPVRPLAWLISLSPSVIALWRNMKCEIITADIFFPVCKRKCNLINKFKPPGIAVLAVVSRVGLVCRLARSSPRRVQGVNQD